MPLLSIGSQEALSTLSLSVALSEHCTATMETHPGNLLSDEKQGPFTCTALADGWTILAMC